MVYYQTTTQKEYCDCFLLWQTITSPITGQCFYYNTKTRKTQFEKPENIKYILKDPMSSCPADCHGNFHCPVDKCQNCKCYGSPCQNCLQNWHIHYKECLPLWKRVQCGRLVRIGSV